MSRTIRRRAAIRTAVDVVEVTRDYIVEEGSFSLTPDNVATDPVTGETTITWFDVARYVGNLDSRLSSEETFYVSFTAKSSAVGIDLPLEADTAAVNYLDPNSINAKNDNGVIPVAILTNEDFDALSVDHTTVTFEGATAAHVDKKTGLALRHEEDVDGDGDVDLAFHFRKGETSLTSASTACAAYP